MMDTKDIPTTFQVAKMVLEMSCQCSTGQTNFGQIWYVGISKFGGSCLKPLSGSFWFIYFINCIFLLVENGTLVINIHKASEFY